MADPSRGDPGVCGGSLEVYVEPVLPEPTILVAGGGHVGRAVVSLASWLGWRVVLSDDRAEFCSPETLPADVVTMRSRVTFLDEESGEQHSVELVYPRAADMEQGRVSVLTPVGAALIGLRRGAAIDWPNRLGTLRRLTIVDVVQPERGG